MYSVFSLSYVSEEFTKDYKLVNLGLVGLGKFFNDSLKTWPSLYFCSYKAVQYVRGPVSKLRIQHWLVLVV